MPKDLRQFIKLAKEAGPEFYVEVNRPLKPEYEVCVLQQKLAKEGHFPLIYCREIEGSKLPLITDAFGSYKLLGLALDITPEGLKTMGRKGVLQEYRRRQAGLKPTKDVPASQAPVQEVTLQGEDVDLGLLPIIHHYELNPAKYISIGMTICKDPDTGRPNVGVYRHEVKGKDRLACMLYPLPGAHAVHIAKRYAELRKPMEVVTVIGHHPAVAMGATGKTPIEKNELEVIGALLDEPLEVTRGLTVDLPVPANAEIAIEGVIDPNKMDTEGPFSESLGYYGQGRPCYIIQITAITMRKDAIYQNLDPIHPEHGISLLYHECNLYDRMKSIFPNVKAIHYASEGHLGKNFMYISIKKRSPGEGRLAGLLALSTFPIGKIAVVVDEDIDVYNEQEVLWAIGNRVRGELDILTIPRMPTTSLNPSARDESGFNNGVMDTKILIDATEPEGFATRVTPPKNLWEAMKLEDYL
ncbi:UbiD family decarboxylase [Chloroflexota bacterium]